MGLTQITTGGVDDNINIDSNTLKVDGTNNRVGIGTSSPSQQLHIASANTSSSGTIIASDSQGRGVLIESPYIGNSVGKIGISGTDSALAFGSGSSNSERMRIDSSGRLLVNTTTVLESSSAAKLHITHTSGALIALGRNDAAVTNGNDMGKIAFYGNDGGAYEKVAQITCEADGPHASGDKPGRLLFSTSADGASSPTERMRIDSAGNVLVGKTASSGLNAGCEFRTAGMGLFTRASANALQVRRLTDDGDLVEFYKDSTLRGSIGVSGTSLTVGVAGNEKLRIDSSGRLLVGTSSHSSSAKFVVQARTTDSSSYANISFQKGSAPTSSNPTLAAINFTDNSERQAAYILGAFDAGTWTDGSSHPGRLVFATTADGSSSATERMRIDSSGRLLVGLSSVSAGHTGKIVSRNDVDYTSTEFEDNATLLLQNETNQNSAVLVFHSNDASGSSGRSAIVGGTVNNGKGKLGFYGSAINKDSSTDADVTIDADGRLLVGVTSARHNDAYLESYRASGPNYGWVETNDIGNGQYSMFRAQASVSGSQTRQAWIGVHKHSGITNPCGFAFLEAEDGANVYYWTDNSNKLRNSTSPSHIGTTSGSLIGTQTSDLRLKNVGANVSYGLAEVKQLQPRQYALKDIPDVNKLGFIAQEVESIIPEAVYDTKEELDGHQEGDRTKLGMEYVQLIPVLVNAIKELSSEVDTLKTKVAALEAAE